jgi:DNA polymerase-3 subunit chi
MPKDCQVDFYVLARPTQSAGELACRLAMMAWEQGHRVAVRADGEDEVKRLDELMWDCPPGRFLPHEAGNADAETPVSIADSADPIPDHRDLVINLGAEPVPEPTRFHRLLEIVPAEPTHRTASRTKFKTYRDQGLSPETHKMG